MQRYIVFLNDKRVTIGQDIISSGNGQNEIILDFTGRAALAEAYKRFGRDQNCVDLKIKADENFPEACQTFNSLFERIEAAGGIVRNQDEEYLFIKRLGFWDLPKGKLHRHEPPSLGALREVAEETGLTGLTITKQLPSTFHIYTDRKGKEVLKETYWFEMKSHQPQPLVPQLEEDITEVKWFSGSELGIAMQNTYASLRSLLEGYLAP